MSTYNPHEAQTVAVYAQRIIDNERAIVENNLLDQDKTSQLVSLLQELYTNIKSYPGVTL